MSWFCTLHGFYFVEHLASKTVGKIMGRLLVTIVEGVKLMSSDDNGKTWFPCSTFILSVFVAYKLNPVQCFNTY